MQKSMVPVTEEIGDEHHARNARYDPRKAVSEAYAQLNRLDPDDRPGLVENRNKQHGCRSFHERELYAEQAAAPRDFVEWCDQLNREQSREEHRSLQQYATQLP